MPHTLGSGAAHAAQPRPVTNRGRATARGTADPSPPPPEVMRSSEAPFGPAEPSPLPPPRCLPGKAVPPRPLTGQHRGRAVGQAASCGHVPAGAQRSGAGSAGARGKPHRAERAGGLRGAGRPGMLGRLPGRARAAGRDGTAPDPPPRPPLAAAGSARGNRIRGAAGRGGAGRREAAGGAGRWPAGVTCGAVARRPLAVWREGERGRCSRQFVPLRAGRRGAARPVARSAAQLARR